VENTNYQLLLDQRGQRQRYILTIYETRVNPADLPFFLGLTEWLADHGITCPRPAKDRRGQLYGTLKGKSAAIIHFLEGRGNPHITPRHLELTGDTMARMHLAATGFPLSRANSMSRPAWAQLFDRIRTRADTITPGLAHVIETELTYLDAHWPQSLPQGIIHADIFPDNVFFIDGHTDRPVFSGIIDFYFACNDALAYDLMICLNAWCFDTSHHFAPERAAALLRSYHAVRPLTPAEQAALPILARASALRFLMTRAHDWLFRVEGALVNPKDPMEYVAKLKFHQSITHKSAYGTLT
jgi:homoserine kinase type II